MERSHAREWTEPRAHARTPGLGVTRSCSLMGRPSGSTAVKSESPNVVAWSNRYSGDWFSHARRGSRCLRSRTMPTNSRPTRPPDSTLASSSSLVSPSSPRISARRVTKSSSVTLRTFVAIERVGKTRTIGGRFGRSDGKTVLHLGRSHVPDSSPRTPTPTRRGRAGNTR